MSLFGVLNRGTTGMFTAQFGVEVASQNAANVNTEGYTRRSATIEPLGPRPLGGAQATGERRILDRFLDQRLLGARSFEGESSARAQTLGVLDTVLADGPGSVGEALDAFQFALNDLANEPQDRGARTVLLGRGEELTQSFQAAASMVAEARADTNDRVRDGVQELNAKLHAIADLGSEIARYENQSSGEAGDLRDRRDQLVREVAEIAPVKVIAEPSGQISMLLGGSLSLVTADGQVQELRAVTDGATGDVSIHRTTAGLDEDITHLVQSGKIGGYIAARDGALSDARDQLDQLAFDVASAYNNVHITGVGLDGASGRNLFEPPSALAGAALALSISADVVGQPDHVAAGIDAAELPGDNRNALALLEVTDLDVALGSTATLNEGYQALIASAGSATRSALRDEGHAANVSTQLQSMREAISGVSTDEEMVSLMRFQRAYQASLKVIQTADDLLGELMTLKR